jgi:hypothetical protein
LEEIVGYRDDLDDTWGDLAPESQEDRSRLPLFLGIGAAVVALLCLCGIGGYILYQEFLATPEPTSGPAVPTLPVSGGQVASPTPIVSQPATPEVSASPSAAVPVLASPTLSAPTQPAPTEAAPTAAVQSGGAVDAVRLPEPPLIDGSLAEWSDVPAWQSAFVVFHTSSWDGSDDLQATWRLAWDSNNLYIGVEVIDDIHVQTQSGNQIFRGDSLDMQIDTDRSGDLGPVLSPDDFQFTFSAGDFVSLPPSAFLSQGTSDGRIVDAPGGNHAIVAAAPTALGYNLEAAMPWSDLNVTPSAGMILGLALNANDNDTLGTAVQEVMKSHVATRKLTEPNGWGTLTLR